MKKWIAVVIVVLILIINPSKGNMFNKKGSDKNDFKEINTIEANGNLKYIKYQENIILGDGKELVAIDSKGDTNSILKLSKDIENFDIDSNSYIDILDKKDNRITSINEKGKTIFTDKVNQETLMYKSLDSNLFVTAYKKDNNQYVRIQDEENSVVKEIEYSGKLTHIDRINESILVADLKTDEGLYSEISLYSFNGEEKQKQKFDEIIVDVICEGNNIYLVFENNIIVLDEELKEKDKISIEGIKSVEQDSSGQLYVVGKENKIICINGEDDKNIKSKSEVVGIEPIGDEYITYSSSSIFNKENKEISNFGQEIKDIIAIGEDIVVVNIEDNIKIYKVS